MRLLPSLPSTPGRVVPGVLGAALVVAGVTIGVGAGAVAPSAGMSDRQRDDGATDELLVVGEGLFVTGCSSCHGVDGLGAVGPDGVLRGPPLVDAGEAGAFFYLASGRMPLAGGQGPVTRKPAAYDTEEIAALVAYVASLGDGPALPPVDVTAAAADGGLAQGGVLFREHCQACHSASGAGGALSYGDAAPPLGPASPEEVAAAARVGPGQMPVFGPDVIDADDLERLVAYVHYLRDPADPGGLAIGRVGPAPEGFVAWFVGVGVFLLLVTWIGTRSRVVRS